MEADDVEQQRRELEILKMCQHPHIIRLLDIFENSEFIYIVMENSPGGDLFTYLEKRSFQLSEERAKTLSHQLATAIFYLQSFGVAHRDLKPENILMSDDTNEAKCKIVDFGLSRFIGPNQTSTDPFGTLSYVAPEVLQGKPHNNQVDVWSLGVITYLLLSGVLPFDDPDEREVARQTIQEKAEFNFPPWEKISAPAIDLCKKMLQKKPANRLNIEQVLNCDWFSQFKKINNRGAAASTTGENQFTAYALTRPDSPEVEMELKDIKARLNK